MNQKNQFYKRWNFKKFISDRAGELRTGHKRTGSEEDKLFFAAASRMRNTYMAKD